MTLADRIFTMPGRSISVVGLAKNVGKTTTLNYLIEAASGRREVKLGITSTGWDGEARDSINAMPKPRIMVPKNCIVATTDECLSRAALPYRVIKKTGMMTSLGEVIIIESSEGGRVEIAGPATISGLCEIRDYIRSLDCTHIFFDGAINRKASSSPDVCDSLILATGMNAGYHMDDVKRRSAYWMDIYSLPLASIEGAGGNMICLRSSEGAPIGTLSPEEMRHSPPLLPSEPFMAEFPGAVTDDLLEPLLAAKTPFTVIACDPTRIFLSPQTFRRCRRGKNRMLLHRKTELTAITVNPMASSGRYYDAEAFLKEMAELCAPYPVWDVVLGKGLNDL